MRDTQLYIDNTIGGYKNSFKSQELDEIIIENKFGGIELDFRGYEFPLGDLQVKINNTFGGIEIYVDKDTNVEIIERDNTLGGIELPAQLRDSNHTINAKIDNTFGGINITRKENNK